MLVGGRRRCRSLRPPPHCLSLPVTAPVETPPPLNRLGYTASQMRVLLVLTVIALILSAVAIIRPLISPVAPSAPLPLLGLDDYAPTTIPPTQTLATNAIAPVTPFILDPNTAPADSLELLPGIGKVLADRIVAYRSAHYLSSPLDLIAVKGIGTGGYERLRHFIRINPHRMIPVSTIKDSQ